MKKLLLLLPLWLLIGCTEVDPEQIAQLKVGMPLTKMLCLIFKI